MVTAHPDDVDFLAAGTVATLTDRGVRVVYCVCTDGDAGGFDPTVPRPEMGRIRRREQTEAALEVGVSELHFLGYPDGRLLPSLELRRDISRVIRMVRPDVVLTQAPERTYDSVYASHPDHRAAGEATLDAVYPDARNLFAHPELAREGLQPWEVPEVWLSTADATTGKVIDITDAFERKKRALMRHRSQAPPRAGTDAEQAATFLDGVLREWAARNAAGAGLPAGRLAEIFKVVATAG